MPRALTPDGHVFEHPWIVTHDFQRLTDLQTTDLAHREKHGERTELAADVEAMGFVGIHGQGSRLRSGAARSIASDLLYDRHECRQKAIVPFRSGS